MHTLLRGKHPIDKIVSLRQLNKESNTGVDAKSIVWWALGVTLLFYMIVFVLACVVESIRRKKARERADELNRNTRRVQKKKRIGLKHVDEKFPANHFDTVFSMSAEKPQEVYSPQTTRQVCFSESQKFENLTRSITLGPGLIEQKQSIWDLAGDINFSCVICFVNFLPWDEVRRLRCRHVYHRVCIDLWFKRHSDCPMCKEDFTTPKNEGGEETTNLEVCPAEDNRVLVNAEVEV